MISRLMQIKLPTLNEALSSLRCVQIVGGSKSLFCGLLIFCYLFIYSLPVVYDQLQLLCMRQYVAWK